MFLGYCFNADGYYYPTVHLDTAEDAWAYCILQHLFFPEIRITDMGDNIVLHVVNHIAKVPQQDGSMKEYSLCT
jgi:hypothetical protein